MIHSLFKFIFRAHKLPQRTKFEVLFFTFEALKLRWGNIYVEFLAFAKKTDCF